MESVETTVVIPILLASRLASVLFPVPLVPASRRMMHCFCSRILCDNAIRPRVVAGPLSEGQLLVGLVDFMRVWQDCFPPKRAGKYKVY